MDLGERGFSLLVFIVLISGTGSQHMYSTTRSTLLAVKIDRGKWVSLACVWPSSPGVPRGESESLTA